MNLHEYQAKTLMRDYGLPLSDMTVVDDSNLAELQSFADQSDAQRFVCKAQIHSGARGKAGGVKVVEPQDLEAVVRALLGQTLVTHQTGPAGLPVHQVLVEPAADIAHEYYLAFTVDRSARRIVLIASTQGGMDIEAVARDNPEAVLHWLINPVVGLQGFQAREVAFKLGLKGDAFKQMVRLLLSAYQLFIDNDGSLLEINPLGRLESGYLRVVDAKFAVDDNALYRHPALVEMRDPSQEDPTERSAAEHGLNYVSLDGDIACMVNGAGLAMATMDLIQSSGGQPANFLDVGGGTSAERVREAFKLILSNQRVNAILVNIFGGIVRCDLIAEGIIAAAEDIQLNVPTVVRLAGTNAEQGRQMLAESGLNLIAEQSLSAAAAAVVAQAKTQQAQTGGQA